MVEDMGCAGKEGKNNGRNKRICGGERRCGERDNEIFGRSMDRKTKELMESCKCNTISLKRINVSCYKRTIISESEYVGNCVLLWDVGEYEGLYLFRLSEKIARII